MLGGLKPVWLSPGLVAANQRSARLRRTGASKPKPLFGSVLVAMLCAAGCANVGTLEPGTPHDAYYFGVIRLQDKGAKAPENPQVQRVTGLGFQFDNGISAGYFSKLRIAVPRGCRVIIINRDERSKEYLQELLTSLGGNELCTAEISD